MDDSADPTPFPHGYSNRFLHGPFPFYDTFKTRPVDRSIWKITASYSLGKLSNDAFEGPSRELSLPCKEEMRKNMGHFGLG